MALVKNMNSQSLTIINPVAFDSLSDIRATLLKDSITDTVVSNIRNIVDVIGRGINSSIEERVGSIVSKVAGEILKQSSIGEDSLDYFKFRINPNKLSVPKKKMVDNKYTGDGFDLDTRGQEMIPYSYKASTGSLVPDNLLEGACLPYLNELFSVLNLGQELSGTNLQRFPQLTANPKLSGAYIKFKLFEQFWEQNNDDLLIFWEDDCYLGKFMNFSYEVDGFNPYQIMYTFDFMVYPDFKYNLLTGYITENSFATIKKTFNRFYGIQEGSLEEKIRSGALKTAPNLTNLAGNATKLTDSQQADEDWFASLGAYPYNRNKTSLLKNLSRDHQTELQNITPRQMADWYKENNGIDIFEDSISFNLRRVIKGSSLSNPNANSRNKGQSPTIDTGESKEEKEILTGNNPDPNGLTGITTFTP